MKILIVNDDGIESEGVHILCKALSSKHNVHVVVPEGERSGYSHHIHFHTPIYYQKVNVDGAQEAYTISGTPVDCVRFAMVFLKIQPDLIISGPNRGANVGSDILYSGTVGAAEEGARHGIKSVALSSASFRDNDFQSCATYFIQKLLPQIFANDFGENVININVPNLPVEKIKGIVVTYQGEDVFSDYYKEVAAVDNRIGYSLEGDMLEPDPTLDWDVTHCHNGYVTVTPLSIDRTNHSLISVCKEIFK